MKRITYYLFLFVFISSMAACLKGTIPPVVVIPEARIDSTFLNYFRQTNGLIAGDGTTSLTLSDGRTLWLFGNSHINDLVISTGMMNCAFNVRNAAMTSDNNFTMTTLNSGASDFIPSNQTGTYFTPLHAYQYVDTVFIFAKKMGGGLNNRTYVAKFHFPDLQFVRVDSFYFNNTNYGYSVMTDKSVGFGYAYGLYQPNVLGSNGMYLARFPLNSLHANWQFYSTTQQAWVDPSSEATALAMIPGENFTIQKVKNKYILITQDSGKICNQGLNIYAQTSAYPYGSFLNYHLIHTIQDNIGGITPSTSGVFMHPQFLNASNEMLLTYALNGYFPCIYTCNAGYDNPDHYRVRTLRVPLKKIDAAY